MAYRLHRHHWKCLERDWFPLLWRDLYRLTLVW